MVYIEIRWFFSFAGRMSSSRGTKQPASVCCCCITLGGWLSHWFEDAATGVRGTTYRGSERLGKQFLMFLSSFRKPSYVFCVFVTFFSLSQSAQHVLCSPPPSVACPAGENKKCTAKCTACAWCFFPKYIAISVKANRTVTEMLWQFLFLLLWELFPICVRFLLKSRSTRRGVRKGKIALGKINLLFSSMPNPFLSSWLRTISYPMCV